MTEKIQEISQHKEEKEISKNRSLTGPLALLASIIAISFSVFQLFTLGVHPISPWLFRAMHLSFVLGLVFILRPGFKFSPQNRISIFDGIFIILGFLLTVYILMGGEALAGRSGVDPTRWDIFFAVVAIALVLESARRYLGSALPIIAIVFLLYAYFGHLIPGSFGLPKYSISKIVSYTFSTRGIYGVAISASAKYVFLFILFGTFMLEAGVGKVFIDVLHEIGQYKGVDWLGEKRYDYYGGCFNFRKKRGQGELSIHSWGIAVDLNPHLAPFKKKSHQPMFFLMGSTFTVSRSQMPSFPHFSSLWAGRSMPMASLL